MPLVPWKLRIACACTAALSFFGWAATAAEPGPAGRSRPNVVIVLTDDQGYGDLSVHGNPVLRTPHLDALHAESVRFTNFHVSPMCTSTRGELMTGQYAFHNGAVHVTQGLSMPRRGRTTLAEIFRNNGYATAHFGKWHLGDNLPYRAHDRGFDASLSHGGWGIGSLADVHGNDYFDDRYRRNGVLESFSGYCTDVWFREAMTWMREQQRDTRPFFVYLATNVPHAPERVAARYSAEYAEVLGNRKISWERSEARDPEDSLDRLARFYGMIANLDENMGRLQRFLAEARLLENTIFVFMTDNGTTIGRNLYNAGMRGGKRSYYDGGHRVPFFVRWPGGDLEARDIDTLTHGIDLLPTLVDLAQLDDEGASDLDGVSLAPLIRRESAGLPDRKLMVMYRKMGIDEGAVLWRNWRLVGGELYDIDADPTQATDVREAHTRIAAELQSFRSEKVTNWEPLQEEINYIDIGAAAEPQTFLSAANWVGGYADFWATLRKNRFGHWNLQALETGTYSFTLTRYPRERGAPIRSAFDGIEGIPATRATLHVGSETFARAVDPKTQEVSFVVPLTARDRVRVEGQFADDTRPLAGAAYLYVERLEPGDSKKRGTLEGG